MFLLYIHWYRPIFFNISFNIFLIPTILGYNDIQQCYYFIILCGQMPSLSVLSEILRNNQIDLTYCFKRNLAFFIRLRQKTPFRHKIYNKIKFCYLCNTDKRIFKIFLIFRSFVVSDILTVFKNFDKITFHAKF